MVRRGSKSPVPSADLDSTPKRTALPTAANMLRVYENVEPTSSETISDTDFEAVETQRYVFGIAQSQRI